MLLNALGHLQSHPGTVEEPVLAKPSQPSSQDHTKRSFLSRLGNIFSSIFSGGIVGSYNKSTTDKKKTCSMII